MITNTDRLNKMEISLYNQNICSHNRIKQDNSKTGGT